MSDLVTRLSQGRHAVDVILRPDKGLPAFREAIRRGYVHIKFPETRGGTELTVKVDQQASCLEAVEAESGSVKIVGTLTLDYVRVQCVAEIDLASLQGSGHLIQLNDPASPTRS